MAYGKSALGKIFISYSTVDKRRVRDIERRLRRAGYDTWLDEKEIEVGDALAARVSDGLRSAKVVVVVVSDASARSKWLRYELDIATERMIQGHCRVMPVLIDEVEVPAELSGRLYADMRPRQRGFSKLLRALESEVGRFPAPVDPLVMDSSDAWVRRQAYEQHLTALSKSGWFSASFDLSAVRSVDIEGFAIGNRDVLVDMVLTHSMRESLEVRDYDDWVDRVRGEANESMALLITEKPLSSKLRALLNVQDRVASQPTGGLLESSGILVVVDLSENLSDSQARSVLSAAYQKFAEAVEHSVAPMIDPLTL